MIPLPPSRPKASLAVVAAAAEKQWALDNPGIPFPRWYVLAVRSYYDASIAPAGNNINAYDDAFFVVSPEAFNSYNGNTDPTRYGWNPNADKYMARVKIGCHKMVKRRHRNKYQAYGQGGNMITVERIKKDGSIAITETGNNFGIDIHPGGDNGTSSEGCLTLPKTQWPSFNKNVSYLLDFYKDTVFDLILVEGPLN